MADLKSRLVAIASMTAVAVLLVACAPATDDAVSVAEPVAAEPAAPLYISTKQVSTDCGVEAVPAPPPGFADRPYAEIAEMPEAIANRQAVGADRPIAATDPDRVSPGYVLDRKSVV